MACKENIFEDLGDGTVAMMCFDRYGCPKPDRVYFNLADLELVRTYHWRTGSAASTGGFYAMTTIRTDSKKTTLLLHRLLLPTQYPLSVDHINRNGLDNRRCNLRQATRHQQQVNRGHQSNSTSGVKGVYREKSNSKWRAHIKIDYKRIHLGYYETLEAAQQARLEAEKKYFAPIPLLPTKPDATSS